MRKIEDIKLVVSDFKEKHCKTCDNSPMKEGTSPQMCLKCKDEFLKLFTKEEISEYNLFEDFIKIVM